MPRAALLSTSAKRLAKGGATAFVIYGGGAAIAFLSQLALTHTLTTEEYGVYAYVLAVMTTLCYGAALGVPFSFLRFIPTYEATEEWSKLRGVVRYGQKCVAWACLATVIGGLIFEAGRTGFKADTLATTFLVGFFLIPVWTFLWVRSAIVRAFGGVIDALAPDRLVRDGALIVIVIGLHFGLGVLLTPAIAMAATIAATAIALLLASLAMHKRFPPQVSSATPTYEATIWQKSAFPLLIAAVTTVLFNRGGVLILGWTGDTRDAGIFGLVFSIAMLAILPRTALDTLFAPTISKLYASKKLDELRGLVLQTAKWVFLTSGAVCAVVAIAAEHVLLLFGPEFVAGADALRVALLGQVIAASAGSQVNILTMTGNEGRSAGILIASTFLNLTISFILISYFGLIGAAWGLTISITFWNLVMAVQIRRHLGIWPGIYGALRLSKS